MKFSLMVVSHTEALLREVLRFSAATDGVFSRYFKDHPALGQRMRSIITEAVYSVLRNKLVYGVCADSCGGATVRRLALLGLSDTGMKELAGIAQEEIVWLEQVKQIDCHLLPATLQSNLPGWLFEKLVAQMGVAETLLFADGLNQPAPLDLRVNTIKTTLPEVLAQFETAGIPFEITPYSAVGLRLSKKVALQNLPIFKEGLIEVQDEGSQILTQIVGAKRGELVVDFCAGAGGKTLLLGAAMRNTGRLYAFDVSPKRLAKFKPRFARSGLSNVHPVLIEHERDVKIKRLVGKADRVLVDAPCSGLGTLRRNPELKWRQTVASITEVMQKQIAILESAARLVKVGGRLVYATCSILNEENEVQVEKFIAANPNFSIIPIEQVLAEEKIPLQMQTYLKLVPHVHHTDGFFAAVLERKS